MRIRIEGQAVGLRNTNWQSGRCLIPVDRGFANRRPDPSGRYEAHEETAGSESNLNPHALSGTTSRIADDTTGGWMAHRGKINRIGFRRRYSWFIRSRTATDSKGHRPGDRCRVHSRALGHHRSSHLIGITPAHFFVPCLPSGFRGSETTPIPIVSRPKSHARFF